MNSVVISEKQQHVTGRVVIKTTVRHSFNSAWGEHIWKLNFIYKSAETQLPNWVLTTFRNRRTSIFLTTIKVLVNFNTILYSTRICMQYVLYSRHLDNEPSKQSCITKCTMYSIYQMEVATPFYICMIKLNSTTQVAIQSLDEFNCFNWESWKAGLIGGNIFAWTLFQTTVSIHTLG